MAFKMNCDRCDKFIKNVSADEMRDTLQRKAETVCKECAKTEETLLKFVEIKQRAAVARLKEFVTSFKDEIQKEMQSQVAKQIEAD
jgi:hypothetical protein